jgi:hypothetical protein
MIVAPQLPAKISVPVNPPGCAPFPFFEKRRLTRQQLNDTAFRAHPFPRTIALARPASGDFIKIRFLLDNLIYYGIMILVYLIKGAHRWPTS